VLGVLPIPRHEEHEFFMAWRGTFDAEAFNAQAAMNRDARGPAELAGDGRSKPRSRDGLWISPSPKAISSIKTLT